MKPSLLSDVICSIMSETVFLWFCVYRIPDSIGKDIEKACQSIYPLHDVYVRKVKMLKKPKFERKWILWLRC